jgi:purine nucleosidase
MPAVSAILEHARARPGELTLVAVGPVTNVARAAEVDSDSLRLLREIVCMGGAFRCPGNITPVAEFNIHVDPEAAQTVLNAGVPLRFVPLDVTERVLIYPEDLDTPVSGRPSAHTRSSTTFWRDLLQHTFEFYVERIGYAGCHLHDPLAIAAVVWPELFSFREAFVEVETAGEVTRGMTVADLRERRDPPAPNCAFAEAVEVEQVRTRVLERLLG